MGGRGNGSPGGRYLFLTQEQLDALPYNVTSFDDALGGAVYPFLERTGRAWRLLTRPVSGTAGEEVAYWSGHTFGQDRPTLRWVNGDQVSDLFVDGMDTEQFLAATGLRLDLHKGAFVLSKRMSRLMRPHFLSGFFERDEVRVGYMEQDARDAKIWDGAGLISRRMLERLVERTVLSEKLSTAKRGRLLYEARNSGRVEFTVMTVAGQDKGHAIVAEELYDDEGNAVDFLLPHDTKREVRLENGQTFVGLSFVHGHDHMRLDIQSLINLHPFFEEEQLLGWLHDEGELFVRSIEEGTVGDVMARIDRHTTLADVQSWPLREYLASGGHPMWFRAHVKSLMNQHLLRLNHTTLEKMRLPIPGGRYYVMPEAVARRAGLGGTPIGDRQRVQVASEGTIVEGHSVPRGHVRIDARRGTAWVNDEDWLALADSAKGAGIADILGGADHDDALWVYPFMDYQASGEAERKVLVWRSPNQVGEYVVLRPTVDSDVPSWKTIDGERVFARGDSGRLPARVDRVETKYLNLVDAETAGKLGEGEVYTVEVMEAAIERALANRGALGMYCNSLMVNKALFGRLPENPPASLEDIIDGAVKTGADLSGVVAWNYENSRQILEARVPVPRLLHGRLSRDFSVKENRPPAPVPSRDHWLDRLERGVRTHIQDMVQRREELAVRAMPPAALFDSTYADQDIIRLGARLNQTYAAALAMGRKGRYSNVLERAKHAVEDFLVHFPPDRRSAILRGALVSVYGGEELTADTAVWLARTRIERDLAQPGIGQFSVASLTIEALREIGVVDEIHLNREGRGVYPSDPQQSVLGERDL